MRSDTVYLHHIRESVDLIRDYLGGPDNSVRQELLQADQRTQDAVLRRLETLADAAGHLTDALKGRHPEIPWRQINDFRNVLAHGYTDIRLDRIWDVIAVDLPALQAAVADELRRTTP